MSRVFRLSNILPVVLLIGAATLHPAHLYAGGPSPTRHLTILLSPNPIALGQMLTITVRGAHPGTGYGFLMRKLPLPNPAVIDMGRYVAPPSGIIRFRPVTFTLRRQIGRYILRVSVVQGQHITQIGATTLRVVL